MEKTRVVAILNETLGMEQRCLASRLLESTVFVSALSVEVEAIVRRLAGAAREHGKWLTDEITRLGGAPGPRVGDLTSGDLHFQELRRLLPRLVKDQEQIISGYALARDRIVSEPQAAQRVSRILGNHEAALEQLKACHDRKIDAVADQHAT